FVQAIGLGSALLFFYVFPDGRLEPRWTRPLALIWIAFTLGWGLNPNAPFNLREPFTEPPLWFATLMAWWGTGLLAQASRYWRGASAAQRQQTRWIVVCLTAAVAAYALVYAPSRWWPALSAGHLGATLFHLLGVPLFLFLVLPIPLAVAFSIYRH